jgi:hypothetical protein
VDLDEVRSSRRDGHLVAVRYVTDRSRWHFFDEAKAREQAAIDRALPDTMNEIVSEDHEERIAIVRASSDVVAPRYYLFLREQRALRPLFEALRTCARRRWPRCNPCPSRRATASPSTAT